MSAPMFRAMTLEECKAAVELREIALPSTVEVKYATVATLPSKMPAASKRFVMEMEIEARSPRPMISDRQAALLETLAQRWLSAVTS